MAQPGARKSRLDWIALRIAGFTAASATASIVWFLANGFFEWKARIEALELELGKKEQEIIQLRTDLEKDAVENNTALDNIKSKTDHIFFGGEL